MKLVKLFFNKPLVITRSSNLKQMPCLLEAHPPGSTRPILIVIQLATSNHQLAQATTPT